MIDSESRALLERFRARDEGALADLYDLMGRRAFALAYRVLGDAAAAEDVVQAAFMTLWEQAERLDPARGSVEGLLLTIVHRRAVDAVRARARLSARTAPLEVDPADEAPTALEGLEAQDRAADVRAALELLPEAQRRVVLLAYFDGLTLPDIAEALQVPLGTVKSRLRLAMQRLRHELGASDGT